MKIWITDGKASLFHTMASSISTHSLLWSAVVKTPIESHIETTYAKVILRLYVRSKASLYSHPLERMSELGEVTFSACGWKFGYKHGMIHDWVPTVYQWDQGMFPSRVSSNRVKFCWVKGNKICCWNYIWGYSIAYCSFDQVLYVLVSNGVRDMYCSLCWDCVNLYYL